MLYTMEYKSPIGDLAVVTDGENILELWITGQRGYDSALTLERASAEQSPALMRTREWLDRYFEKEKPSPHELPLAPAGSSFRQAVWKILCEIPYGEVITYGEIAKRIALQRGIDRMASQAVGGAVGHNPISIVIPCHRVVGAGGNLTGYGGGIPLKQALLAHESVDLSGFYVPGNRRSLF